MVVIPSEPGDGYATCERVRLFAERLSRLGLTDLQVFAILNAISDDHASSERDESLACDLSQVWLGVPP